jgi:hypothetical protein
MTRYPAIVGIAAVACSALVVAIISLRNADTVRASRASTDHRNNAAQIGRSPELKPPLPASISVEQSAETSIRRDRTEALAYRPASSAPPPIGRPRFASEASKPIDSVPRLAEANRRAPPTSFAHPTERADEQIVSEMVSALTVELDYGVPLPVVLLPRDQPATFEQASAESRITSEFAKSLRLSEKSANAKEAGAADPRLPAQRSSDTGNAPLTAEEGQIEDVYIDAQLRADERYRLLYGDTAYIHQAIKAARAALTEE